MKFSFYFVNLIYLSNIYQIVKTEGNERRAKCYFNSHEIISNSKSFFLSNI